MPRPLRIALACTTSTLLVVLACVFMVIGNGRILEDACVTKPPPEFAAEFTVVRGPIREGVVTFRCQHVGAPDTAYVFTDFTPLVGTATTLLATVVALFLLGRWAARGHRPA